MANKDTGIQLAIAGAIGFVFGDLTGGFASTIAKAGIRFLLEREEYTRMDVAQATMTVVFLAMFVVVCLVAVLQRRAPDKVSVEQVLLFMLTAIVRQSMSVWDLTLPEPGSRGAGEPEHIHEMAYYLGWGFLLILPPLFFLPGNFRERVRRGSCILVVAMFMCMGGGVAGEVVDQVVELLQDTDREHFWVARPRVLDAMAGSYVAVAFAGIWWRDLWDTETGRRRWILGWTVVASLYAGVYGWFYCECPHAQHVLAFGSIPATIGVIVWACCELTPRRDKNNSPAVDWPVTRFRGLPGLPVCMALAGGLALVAWVGLAPLEGTPCHINGYPYGASEHPEYLPRYVALAHGFNGVVLGVVCCLMAVVIRFLRERGLFYGSGR